MSKFIDIHCHIIPEVDDGAKDIQEAQRMLEMAYSEGIRTIIATPHHRKGHYTADIKLIEKKLKELKILAHKIDDNFEVYLGSEIFGFRGVLDYINDDVITIANSRYILIEFLPKEEYSTIRDVLYEFQSKGYNPILAHVERYEELRRDFKKVEDLNEMGIYLQVNASSILRFRGFKLKRFIKKLINEDMLHFIATDAHDIKQRQVKLNDCALYLEKKYGVSYMEDLLINNPKKIIENQYI